MVKRFVADSVEYWSEDDHETVFFGNEAKELALTISGAGDGHYLEWNDQSNACAGAVKSAELSGRKLRIQLLAKAARKLGETGFAMDLVCDDETRESVTEGLRKILGKRFTVAKGAVAAAPGVKHYGTIRYLNLEGKNLKALPQHVTELTALEVAKLARNPGLDFREVCEVLSRLPALKELSFTTDGPVPDNIGALRQLESLQLDGFTKPRIFPESFGQLTKLKRLQIMSDSDIVLPDTFAELTGIEELNIRAASWQAPVHLHKLAKLTTLDLGNCRFAGDPVGLAGMQSVTTVFLEGQSTEDYAKLLPIVAKMPNLRTLQLATQCIPQEVALFTRIEELVVWGARGVPSCLGRLQGLKKLVLAYGDFESLPEEIGDLSNLTVLSVTENPSLRTLPESLGKLKRLRRLLLHENPRLTRLPDSLQALTELETHPLG